MGVSTWPPIEDQLTLFLKGKHNSSGKRIHNSSRWEA